MSPIQFVATLFPNVEAACLTGLATRVTRLKLIDVGEVVDLNLNRQAAMCIEVGALESVALTNGVWEAFWHSPPGTVFNTDGLQRKLQEPCMCRVVEPTILMLLSADDLESEVRVNQALSDTLHNQGE